MKKSLGFSFLELVLVVMVVSLVAIMAIPKFIDMVDEAKKSSVKTMAATYASAVISARAQWEVDRKPKKISLSGAAYNQVDYDGSKIWLVDLAATGLSDYQEGYPISVSDGDRNYTTSVSNEDCVLLMDNLLQNPPMVLSVGAKFSQQDDVRYLAQAKSNTCIYFQQEGAQHSFMYDIKTGRVTVHIQQ